MLPRSFALLVAACAALAFSPSARAETAPPAAPPAEQQPPAPAPAAAAAKPAARREDVEPETLPAALASLKTARADRDTAESDLAAEQAEHGKTKQLLSGTLEIATKAKADLALAQTEITTLTAARDKAVAEQGKTKELLTLAEAACGVLGVDPANAVPAAPPSASEAQTIEGLRSQLAASTDPVNRGKLAAQLRQLTTARK